MSAQRRGERVQPVGAARVADARASRPRRRTGSPAAAAGGADRPGLGRAAARRRSTRSAGSSRSAAGWPARSAPRRSPTFDSCAGPGARRPRAAGRVGGQLRGGRERRDRVGLGGLAVCARPGHLRGDARVLGERQARASAPGRRTASSSAAAGGRCRPPTSGTAARRRRGRTSWRPTPGERARAHRRGAGHPVRPPGSADDARTFTRTTPHAAGRPGGTSARLRPGPGPVNRFSSGVRSDPARHRAPCGGPRRGHHVGGPKATTGSRRGACTATGWLCRGGVAAGPALGDHDRMITVRPGWTSWAPSGRLAVPVIVRAGHRGQPGRRRHRDDAADRGRRRPRRRGRAAVLVTAAALPRPGAARRRSLAGLRRQRVTNRWLMADRDPTADEAGARAAAAGRHRPDRRAGLVRRRRPRSGSSPPLAFPDARVGLRTGVATLLGGHGHRRRHLSAGRPRRAGGHRARARRPSAGRCAHPRGAPAAAAHLGADQRGADARRRPAVPRPEQPAGPGRGGRRLPGGGRAARRRPRHAAHRPGRRAAAARPAGGRRAGGGGDYDVRVVVDDAGEIGLLQEGVNSMAAGLAEREQLRDLFGRHVGTAVAQQALRTGVSPRRRGAHRRGAVRRHRRLDLAGAPDRARRRWWACSTGSSRSSSTPSRPRAAWSTSSRATPRSASSARPPTTTTRPAPRCGRPGGSATRSGTPARWTSGSAWPAGPVWAGQVGAAQRLEYTVIGDPVNEAARLTELAKDHPGRAVASEATVLAAARGRAGALGARRGGGAARPWRAHDHVGPAALRQPRGATREPPSSASSRSRPGPPGRSCPPAA